LNDLLAARKLRRKALCLIRQQQVADAECVNHVRSVAMTGKRRLLTCLSDWLNTFTPDLSVSNADSRIFAEVAGSFSLGEWHAANREITRLVDVLADAQKAAVDAESAYQDIASFGVLSIWFKDGEEKVKAQQLRLDFHKAKQRRESIETELRVARSRSVDLLRQFLRVGSTGPILNLFCAHPHVGHTIRAILEDTAADAQKLWSDHVQVQRTSIATLSSVVDELKGMYVDGQIRLLKEISS
jgi:hypothetical protein